LPATLLLAATALALAVVTDIPFSLMTTVKQGTWLPLRTPLEVPSSVVDTEPGFFRLGMVQPVSEAMGAQHLKLEDLPADNLAEVVRMQIPVGGEPPPHIG